MARKCATSAIARAGPLICGIGLIVLTIFGCARSDNREPKPIGGVGRTSILLVTLDTTRADAIGPEAKGIVTPAFNAIAAGGLRFSQAYTAVPETLPSHISMMTGLYPARHGVHENARYLSRHHELVAERLQQAGYRTAAFVSSFVLARRFGLARGFDVYDDELPPGGSERASKQTTDRAVAYLRQPAHKQLFLWVHYFDPHAPYAPSEPFRSQHADTPYLGEVAAMDDQLGRLVQAFEQHVKGPVGIVIASDHGEGLGDHGESQHGNLLYGSTMHVPLLLAGEGITPGVSDTPVSSRRIYHTILDWAGWESVDSLRRGQNLRKEVVLGEAMKPFLEYGWQPQIMAVHGRQKAVLAGRQIEVYDLAADPFETRNVGAGENVSADVRKALEGYPLPSPDAARAPEDLSPEARRSLASLGYVSASAPPTVRKDAPRPADMVHLFDALERASELFVQEKYAEVVPLLERILAEDTHNLDAALRLAIAHSVLGHHERALDAFRRAAAIAPRSTDVRTYLALHYARGKEWQKAVPLLERTVEETPDRLPAVEALAGIREKQGRIEEAVALRQKIHTVRAPTSPELVHLARLAMQVGGTPVAIESFEKARALQGARFEHDLELGVLYLAARRFQEARDALDRVPPSHPEYPMALFKRAQLSVLLNEPDSAVRIQKARESADGTTRELIASERLFQNVPSR